MKVPVDPEGVFAALRALAKKPRRQPWSEAKRRAAVAQLQAGHVAKRKRLQREAWERRRRVRRGRRVMPRYGERLQDRILTVMQPGQWHATADLMAASGAPRHARAKLFQVIRPAGYVESAKDPEWVPRPGGYKQAPGFHALLWRLTRRGELEREALLLLA